MAISEILDYTRIKSLGIRNLQRFVRLYLAAIAVLSIVACQPITPSSDLSTSDLSTSDLSTCDLSTYDTEVLWNYGFNTMTWNVMKNRYYWHDELPETRNITSEDPNLFLSSMLHEKDESKNFSKFRSTYDYLTGIYGVTASPVHGFALIEYDGKVYLSNVYQGSEAAKEGIKRGYRIVSIGGNSSSPASATEAAIQLRGSSTNTIVFEKPDGSQVTFDKLKKSEITYPFVMPIVDDITGTSRICTVIQHDNKKVGYMHYLSFLSSTDEELLEAIKYFNDYDGGGGIDELIVDLRYNGGGYLSHCSTLISAILSEANRGTGVLYLKFNPQYKNYLEAYKTLSQAQLDEKEITNLGLARVFVLTTGNSASASEALITALRPFIPVHHIGQKTYGKPVGQEVYMNHEAYGYVFFLVAFAVFNKDAIASNDLDNSLLYFDGIDPDYVVSEFKEETITTTGGAPRTLYVLKEFGSEEDPLVEAALHFIEHGTYPNAQAGVNENTVSTMDKQAVIYHTEYPTSMSLFRSPDDLRMSD